MTHNDQNCKPNVPDVVYVVNGEKFTWTGHNAQDLQGFIKDARALGQAVLETPAAVYIYAGESNR